MILCKFRISEGSTLQSDRKYLCLPVFLREASTLYRKKGLPISRRVKVKWSLPEVRFQRISIELKPESKRLLLYDDWAWFVPKRLSAVILSLQGQGSSSKQFFLHDLRYSSSAVLLRHGSTEAVILYGWYEAGSIGNTELVPWTVITDWEDLPTVRNIIPTEVKRKKPGEFAQRRLSSGAHMYCTIKPRPKEWCLSHRNTMSESQFQALVDQPRVFFSLDVVVKSPEGRSERIGYLGSKDFSDYARLGDWIDESNSNPRDVLLANPQWRREF